MPGALLRSGKLQEFKPLGEDGQPVYTAALQLREAIRLKLGRDAAHCLAIPQRNETGDRIDWYAPEEGDVVPWSAATDEERIQAKAMLEKMHADLLQVGNAMRGEQSRDRQIFGRLLEKVIHFPDDTHVYLVNGKPVLTFWGFTDTSGTASEDPLGRLQPRAPVQMAVPAAAPEPVPPPPPAAPVVIDKKRFPWWWLLLIPLLLLLLWLLLRSCTPEVPLPSVNPPEIPEERPLQPGETGHDGIIYDADGNAVGVGGVAGADGEAPAPGEEPVPDLQQDEAPAPEEAPAEEPGAEPATEEPAAEEPAPEPQPEEPPAEQPQEQQPVPPPLQDEATQQPGQQPPAAKPLEIPPEAAQSGKTDFLNGKWKAGAGIQDARTGKPMRLDYDFKDGKGQVKVSGPNGMECVGDVNAAMSGGGLVISNQGQARCNDGSTYKLPEVTCQPGATSAADCTGQYENSNRFPMSMKQGG